MLVFKLDHSRSFFFTCDLLMQFSNWEPVLLSELTVPQPVSRSNQFNGNFGVKKIQNLVRHDVGV